MENHTCNEDTSKSMQMILNPKDTKPCPSCFFPIHKLAGCNDMFCVQCKTAFNWTTLAIHPNGNSNQLYQAWAQTVQNHTYDGRPAECGDQFTISHVLSMPLFKKADKFTQENIKSIMQNIGDVFRYASHRYKMVYSSNNPNGSIIIAAQHLIRERELRNKANLLQNELTKDGFEKKSKNLFKLMKQAHIETPMIQLLVDVKQDFINRIMNCSCVDDIVTCSNELSTFMDNMFEQFVSLEHDHAKYGITRTTAHSIGIRFKTLHAKKPRRA